MIGVGDAAVTAWDIAKWPVLVLLVSFVFSILYWAAPNVRQPGFRWLTPGGVLAVLLWIVASAAFALYVANFASYNKTYGSLGGVIVVPDLAVDLEHRRAPGRGAERRGRARSRARSRGARGSDARARAARPAEEVAVSRAPATGRESPAPA